MTTINLERLPAGRIAQTVWGTPKLDKVLPEGQSELRIDGDKLELLFSQKKTNPSLDAVLSRGGSVGLAAAPAEAARAQKVVLLEPKRATNVGILIAQLKMPARRGLGPNSADSGSATPKSRGSVWTSLGGSGVVGKSSRFEEISEEELREAIMEANTTTGPFSLQVDPLADPAEQEAVEKVRTVTLAQKVLEIMPTAEEVSQALAPRRAEPDARAWCG